MLVQGYYVVSNIARFGEYLKFITIFKLINEGVLVCGLCLLLSNVFDKCLTGNSNEEISADRSFMTFMDEQIENMDDDSEDDNMYDLIHAHMVMLKSREPTLFLLDLEKLGEKSDAEIEKELDHGTKDF